MRKQLTELQNENVKLSSALTSHGVIIGDILTCDKLYTSTEKLKLDDSNKTKCLLGINFQSSKKGTNNYKGLKRNHDSRNLTSVVTRPELSSASRNISQLQVMDNEQQTAQGGSAVLSKTYDVNRLQPIPSDMECNSVVDIDKQMRLSVESEDSGGFETVKNKRMHRIKQYLVEGVKGDYEVSQLRNRYPGYRSFKIGVPVSLWHKVFLSDFWPTGVYVSRFRFPKVHKEEHVQSFLEEHTTTEAKI
ncbi:hypothetical protein J6590_077362 [Homalodisca vitripennis]|nr:hypothetical protein J6590_077362 [Homalodisca vitripennis]